MQTLTDAVGANPFMLPAWLLLAALYFRVGRYPLAKDAAGQGLLHLRFLHSRYSLLSEACHTAWHRDFLRLRALSYGGLRDWERALRVVEQWEQGDAAAGEAPDHLRAELLVARGDVDGARAALARHPCDAAHARYVAAIVAVHAGDVSGGLSAAEAALALRPGHPRYQFLCGKLCVLAGADLDPQRAVQHLLAAAKADPDHAECFAYLGHHYCRQADQSLDATAQAQNTSRAIKCYERAIGLDPEQAVVGRQLVRIYRHTTREGLGAC